MGNIVLFSQLDDSFIAAFKAYNSFYDEDILTVKSGIENQVAKFSESVAGMDWSTSGGDALKAKLESAISDLEALKYPVKQHSVSAYTFEVGSVING